jgi:hypothetical protein
MREIWMRKSNSATNTRLTSIACAQIPVFSKLGIRTAESGNRLRADGGKTPPTGIAVRAAFEPLIEARVVIPYVSCAVGCALETGDWPEARKLPSAHHTLTAKPDMDRPHVAAPRQFLAY